MRTKEQVAAMAATPSENDTKYCPMCGKRKRGWRTQMEETLCAACDKNQETQRKECLS